ncbi:5-hydroxytryptamine receptor 3A-like [Ranitomeya imitator]|uniref:5-hydroxytryptamine receptor 3A-like n=1 Tax=Ranitomeya imitator TaxID=111125 RepID=UPI0037E8DB75
MCTDDAPIQSHDCYSQSQAPKVLLQWFPPTIMFNRTGNLGIWWSAKFILDSRCRMSPYLVLLLLPVVAFDTGQCQFACSFQNVLKTLNLSRTPSLRPVKDWRTTSIVYLDLTLYTIVDLDMKEQTAVIFIWFYMSWIDEFMSWNPDVFCGLKKMFISSDYFWTPDLYIYEMIESDDNSPNIPYYRISYNGKIVNTMPMRIVVSCKLNVFTFPFDNQTCTLSFGSYVYTVSDIFMLPKSNSSVVNKNAWDVFTSKGDWVLEAVTVQEKSFVTEGEEYNQVIYSIYISRTPMIYILNLIIPAYFLVFLDIVSMFIQSFSERLGFKITIVLGFSVLLLILNDMLPSSDNTPMLGIFCCICMAMMVLSILGTITTLYMLEQSNTSAILPLWINKVVFTYLAQILCFKKARRAELVTLVTVDNEPESAKKVVTNEGKNRTENKHFEKEMYIQEVKLLKKLLSQILKIRDELNFAEKEKEAKSDWLILAQIVDRLVLVLYLITVSLVFTIMICVWTLW